jgi:hypothetical protein
MSVFERSEGESFVGATLGPSYGGKDCKPDMEKVIKELRKSKDASQGLFDALDNYLDTNGGRRNSVADALLGGLHREIKRLDRDIAMAIAQQEKLAESE